MRKRKTLKQHKTPSTSQKATNPSENSSTETENNKKKSLNKPKPKIPATEGETTRSEHTKQN